jgi:nucleoside-diphosphate-sugar epimerase
VKAFVTGGTGFVGSHLVEALARRGDRITALVRSPHKATRLRELGAELVAGDLHDGAALTRGAADADVVYHVAGLVAARSEAAFLTGNRDGTAHVVAAAEAAGTPRLVFVSTMAAGGPSERGRPLTGSEPPRPVTRYGRSKLAAEEVVRASALPWTIVRPPMVYGPRDTEVLKVFRIARGGVAPVFGDGSQELSAVHAADLADALIAAASAPATVGGTYYAAHPEIFTSAGFVRAVARALGRTARVIPLPLGLARAALAVTELAARAAGRATILTTDKAHEFFQRAWTGDPAPLARDAGWRAARNLEQGLAETAAWYRAHGWL